MLLKLCLFGVLASLCASAPVSEANSCPYGMCLYITNNCPMDLYIDRTTIDDNGYGLVFNATELGPGNSTILDVTQWVGLPGQRLYAWWTNPVVGYPLDSTLYADKVEIYICDEDQFCYDPTAVDYLALPVSLAPQFPADCPDIPVVGTLTRPIASVKTECPTVWVEGAPWGVCRSSGFACYHDPTLSFCDALDPVVDECIAAGICPEGMVSENVYDCTDWFAGQPGYCAAINRGVYPSLDQEDPSLFYQTSPYNVYAQWIHTNLTREYAFPYDSYEGDNSNGHEQCDTNSLQIIWCPDN
jgi:hypothetical protein